MEEYQIFFGFILATLSMISSSLIFCGGSGKKKSSGKDDNKKSSKRPEQMAINTVRKPAKDEQSYKPGKKDETMVTEDPDLKSRDNYEIKTKDEKEEIEKIEKNLN